MVQNEFEQLRDALSNGTISKADMEARLTALIEEAYGRSPVDAAFIAACEALLQAVITGDAAPQPSVTQACRRVIRENSRSATPAPVRRAGRCAAAAAVLIALFCLGALLPDRQWIAGDSTPDGSAYVIRSHRLDAGFVSASAIEYIDDGSALQLTTQSRDELTACLGFDPPVVDAAALGLNPQGQYDVFTSETSRTVIQSYSSAGAGGDFRFLTITMIDYASPGNVLFAIQQSRPGKNVTLDGGQEVYVAVYAIEKPLEEARCISVTWMDGTRLYHLSGSLDEADMMDAAQAIAAGAPLQSVRGI